MEIQVTKLRELMELLKPVVLKKSTLTVTSYIRLGEGKVVATDLETMITAYLPEAVEPMLLPFASLADMLKYVPGNETLKIEVEGKKVFLTWAGGNASYPTEDAQDFPILPEMPIRAEGTVDGDTLVSMMLDALPYVSTEDTRPVLSGVTLVLGNPIEVDAGDGFRMSHQVLGLSFPLEEKVIVPAHSVRILGHVFAKTPRTPPTDALSLIPIITARRYLRMALVGENKLQVDFGQTATVVINLIAGTPPDFIRLIPKGEPILQSQIFAPQLEAAVKRVRDVAKDGSGIVRMVFADGKLTISAKGDEQEITATIDTLSTQGEPGRTAPDHRYLIDYLSGKQGIIVFSQYDKTAPLSFQYQNSPMVLVMPMYVQWEDEKTPAGETTEPEDEVEAVDEAAGEEDSHEEQAGEVTIELDAEEEAPTTEQEPGKEEPVSKKPARRARKKVTT